MNVTPFQTGMGFQTPPNTQEDVTNDPSHKRAPATAAAQTTSAALRASTPRAAAARKPWVDMPEASNTPKECSTAATWSPIRPKILSLSACTDACAPRTPQKLSPKNFSSARIRRNRARSTALVQKKAQLAAKAEQGTICKRDERSEQDTMTETVAKPRKSITRSGTGHRAKAPDNVEINGTNNMQARIARKRGENASWTLQNI
mmetsp:Transcript_39837/g.120326  ORF Transcript_39837/g.120326 Transcript_39837/m.120326 type:complete len:204 (-) Transcript_39837:395-1006(-)